MARRRRSSRRNPFVFGRATADRDTPGEMYEVYTKAEIDKLLTSTQTGSQRTKRTQSSSSAASVSPDDPITFRQAKAIGGNLGNMQDWCPAAHARLSQRKGKVTRHDVLVEMGVTAGVASEIMQALTDIGFDDSTKEQRKAVVQQMLAEAGITCELPGSAKQGRGRTSTASKSKKRRSSYYSGNLPF